MQRKFYAATLLLDVFLLSINLAGEVVFDSEEMTGKMSVQTLFGNDTKK